MIVTTIIDNILSRIYIPTYKAITLHFVIKYNRIKKYTFIETNIINIYHLRN